MASQLMLFTVEASKQENGSFVITPTKVWADREIDVATAMKHLGYRSPKRIYWLLDHGKIRGWKNETNRGNGKWRIYEQSVLDYKHRRTVAADNGVA